MIAYGPLDLAGAELVSSDPATDLFTGRLIYNTTSDLYKIYDAGWVALSSAASTETLTNKTIDGDDNTVQDLALTSLKTVLGDADKVLRRDNSGVVVSGNALPNSSEIVTIDASQTLTAKTIDGDDNTVSDLALTSLKTVLADASNFIVRDASGIPVSNTKAVPSGTVVGTSDAQVLTAKDYDGGTASDTSRITLPKNTTSNLNGLSRKEGTVVYDTDTDSVKYDNGSSLVALATSASIQDSSLDYKNGSITASVGASALTISLKDKSGGAISGGSPVSVAFRNATASTGTYTTLTISAAPSDLVISSGSTLGHQDATTEYIYVYLINNAGSAELAASSRLYDDGSIVSTTAEGGAGAADTKAAIYSTTARANVALRLIGRLKSSQTTAGTWASAPLEISNIPFQSAFYGLITPWTSYTPSASVNQGFGTIASPDFFYQRIGQLMHINGRWTTGTVSASEARIALPTGYSIATWGVDNHICGTWQQSEGTGGTNKTGWIIVSSGQGYLKFTKAGGLTENNNPFTVMNGNDDTSSANSMMLSATVPVAEWVF